MMNQKLNSLISCVWTLVLGFWLLELAAESVKDREGAVRQDRATMENDKRWIYNDYRRGLIEAQQSGKPLLVVLRCVPCLACAGIDASVLTDASLAPLLDRFVCVRVINGNALDLSLFQVDFDLSFSAVFLNGDGALYGRYGSWVHQKDQHNKSISGFRASLESILDLHRGYPANKSKLAGKQGGSLPYKSTLDVPGLSGKYNLNLDWNGKVVPSCVHCHQINEAIRDNYHRKNEVIPDEWIYPWPSPETIGVSLALDQAVTVATVDPISLAARAGMRPGDQLAYGAGQPLCSAADLSWVLHRAADSARLKFEVLRDGKRVELELELPEGWRRKSDISRRAGTWQLRGIASGGLWLEDLDDDARKSHGLASDRMALLVKHAGEYGHHAAAKKAGFRNGDVLLEVEGVSVRKTEGQVLGDLLRGKKKGESIRAKVLRDGATLDLAWPMQ